MPSHAMFAYWLGLFCGALVAVICVEERRSPVLRYALTCSVGAAGGLLVWWWLGG